MWFREKVINKIEQIWNELLNSQIFPRAKVERSSTVEDRRSINEETNVNDSATTQSSHDFKSKPFDGEVLSNTTSKRKRCFDMDALLAPDHHKRPKRIQNESIETINNQQDFTEKNYQTASHSMKPIDIQLYSYPLYMYDKQTTTFNPHQQPPDFNRYVPLNNRFPDLNFKIARLPAHNSDKIVHQTPELTKTESDNIDIEKWKQTFSKIMARSYKNSYYSLNVREPMSQVLEIKSNSPKTDKNKTNKKSGKVD